MTERSSRPGGPAVGASRGARDRRGGARRRLAGRIACSRPRRTWARSAGPPTSSRCRTGCATTQPAALRATANRCRAAYGVKDSIRDVLPEAVTEPFLESIDRLVRELQSGHRRAEASPARTRARPSSSGSNASSRNGEATDGSYDRSACDARASRPRRRAGVPPRTRGSGSSALARRPGAREAAGLHPDDDHVVELEALGPVRGGEGEGGVVAAEVREAGAGLGDRRPETPARSGWPTAHPSVGRPAERATRRSPSSASPALARTRPSVISSGSPDVGASRPPRSSRRSTRVGLERQVDPRRPERQAELERDDDGRAAARGSCGPGRPGSTRRPARSASPARAGRARPTDPGARTSRPAAAGPGADPLREALARCARPAGRPVRRPAAGIGS